MRRCSGFVLLAFLQRLPNVLNNKSSQKNIKFSACRIFNVEDGCGLCAYVQWFGFNPEEKSGNPWRNNDMIRVAKSLPRWSILFGFAIQDAQTSENVYPQKVENFRARKSPKTSQILPSRLWRKPTGQRLPMEASPTKKWTRYVSHPLWW